MRCSVSTSSAMTFSCSMGSGIGDFFEKLRSLGTWTDFPMANIATARCTFLFHDLNSTAPDGLLASSRLSLSSIPPPHRWGFLAWPHSIFLTALTWTESTEAKQARVRRMRRQDEANSLPHWRKEEHFSSGTQFAFYAS